MYAFESTIAPTDMVKYLFMPMQEIQKPKRLVSMQKAIEFIRPRIETMLKHPQLYMSTLRAKNDKATLYAKTLAVCEGLNKIRVADQPEIRIERLQNYASRYQAMLFTRFQDQLIDVANPTLIEWMLALMRFGHGREEARAEYKDEVQTKAHFTKIQRARNKAINQYRDSMDDAYELQIKLARIHREMNEALDIVFENKRVMEAAQQLVIESIEEYPWLQEMESIEQSRVKS